MIMFHIGRKIKENMNWRTIWPYLLILILGLALYGRAVFFDFTYLDDNALIIENYPIISRVENIGKVFSDDVFFSPTKFYYRPLLNISLMVDAAIGGKNVAVFHFSNILFHIIAAWLVFYLFKRLKRSNGLSLFFSLLFLVHPVLAQAVAWIPGRNDSLLAISILAAFLCFLEFSEQPEPWSYLFYIFFFFAALLLKETAIFLPILVIFYCLFIEPKKVASRDFWLLILGSFSAGFIWFLMRRLALGGEITGYLAAAQSAAENFPAILLFIGKLIFPFNLAVFPVLADSTYVYGLLAVGVLIFVWLFSRQRRNNFILFGLVWFILFLLPSFIRPNGLPDFLEHRVYLSFIGFLIILGELDVIKDLDWRNKRVRIGTAAALLLLAGLSFYHLSAFRDRISFWESAAATSPHSPLVQRNLGAMYYLGGNSDLARVHYEQALKLNPQETMAHNNLGVIYYDQKKYDLAEKEYKAELAINPSYDKALFNLGEIYHVRQQDEAAAQMWTEALQANPNNYQAYERLLIFQKKLR